MTRISLNKVVIDFPVPALRARSLKSILIGKVKNVGGNLRDSGTVVPVVRALDGIDLELKEGDRLGLVGPNGAGKTTFLRVLSGVYPPVAGSIEISGSLVPMFDIGIGLDDESTGFENIVTRGLIMGLSEREIDERLDDIADFSELGPYLHMPIRTYSAGMTLRLMFSIATSIQGNIVLMDEWISVGDQSFKDKANARLRALTDKAGILVIASHDSHFLRETCNLGLHLEEGKIKNFGPVDEVISEYQQQS